MRRLTDCAAAEILGARAEQTLPGTQRGLTTVEYAVAGALVAAALVGAFNALGVQVGDLIAFLTNAIAG